MTEIPLPGNKPLSDYESSRFLIPEGTYEVHICSVSVDEINDKMAVKAEIYIDGTPSYCNANLAQNVGKKFEHVFYITTDALFIVRQLCDALNLPESVLGKSKFDPTVLLNKPFVVDIIREKRGQWTNNKLQIGTFQKSTHNISTIVNNMSDKDYTTEEAGKEDLPF